MSNLSQVIFFLTTLFLLGTWTVFLCATRILQFTICTLCTTCTMYNVHMPMLQYIIKTCTSINENIQLNIKSPKYFSELLGPSIHKGEVYTKNVAYYLVILQNLSFRLKVLQVLQGNFLSFHLQIQVLKFFNELACSSSEGIRFHMISPKHLIELEPI